MNVSLTPELERLIQARVASGMYGNASEVVREALRMLFSKEFQRREAMAELNAELMKGYEQVLRGEVSSKTPDQIFDDAVAEFQQETQSKA